MMIFLAGATGALGRQLLPRLVERGHEVTGMTRRESKQQLIRDLGWTDSEMCRQVRLILAPFCGHRRRCLRGFGRG